MKNIIYIIPVIAFLLSACELKEEDPKTELTPGKYYETLEGYNALINGCYAPLITVVDQEEGMLYSTDLGTDLWTWGQDGKYTGNDLYTVNFDGSNKYIKNLWQDLYEGINYTNNGVYYGELHKETAEGINLKAQAHFLRAYYNFIIVQTWGGVHLTLEPTEQVETSANRTPVPEFFNAIIADLEYAIENLDEVEEEWGRPNKYAAMSLMVKVLLTDVRSGTEEFQYVLELVDNVKNAGYKLLENREDVFDYFNPDNGENIWSLQHVRDESLYDPNGKSGGGGRLDVNFISYYQDSPNNALVRSKEYGRSYARLAPTQYYLSLFDVVNDSRYEAYFRSAYLCNIYPNGAGLEIGDTALWYPNYYLSQAQKDSADYVYFEPNQINKKWCPSLRKYDDPTWTSSEDNVGTKDVPLIRLADLYLLAAEAHYRLGNDDFALAEVNAIRENAAWPGKESAMRIPSATHDELVDIILVERALELGGELNRFFDLKRFGVMMEYMQERRPDTSFEEFHLLRPIPEDQIQRSSPAYEQNPGYVY